ncbi:dipeptide-binding protein DppE [Bifidobacterium hapali]|uniref:Dipeptide-binding protein DppE n=1 Tax=Bifidobacterium hapali TaxID=1630172 RepID=A0A261G4M3_9BIFI|nr:dipeptide-binding protein DppE [Bifidobacterium hapali]
MARNLLSSSIRSSLITSRSSSSTTATSVAYKPTTNRLTSRRAASIIASIAAIVMALSACGSGGGTTANSNAAGNSSESARTTLKWEASGEVTTMDSGKTYDTISGEAVGFFAEPLYRQNSKGDVEPALAASLPTVSKDGLTVDVTLRDGLKFSDGSPLTAADVVYAAKRVVDPATGSQSAKNLNYIKNATEITAGKTPVDQLGVKATSDTQL